jgi:DNA-binding CsgD family transcriptional regulator/tetratricopeptide (TPR) repeat protein
VGGKPGKARLLEREEDLAAVAGALDDAADGGALLITGPPGVGKTALLGAVGGLAGDRGHRVLRARGSEMERDFSFGVVRQLLGTFLRSLPERGRAGLLAGPAALAAGVFGLGDDGGLDLTATESSLYGLFWLLAGLAEAQPLVLAIDDAHWADSASLRFVRYLAQRLDGLPILIVLAAREHESGAQAELVRNLAADLEVPTLAPAPLSEAGTGALVRERLGDVTDAVAGACHEATGGNPFLIEELLAELDAGGDGASVSPTEIETMRPQRVAAAIGERARRVDPLAPAALRAAAVLGDAENLRAVGALAGTESRGAAAIVDGLVSAAILAPGAERRFVHPLVRAAVYEEIPTAGRARLHADAAAVLGEQGADPEAIAAHLLLCEPGDAAGALATLEAAADAAARRGAPDSAIAYLRRALVEPGGDGVELLAALGNLEVLVRDTAAIAHLIEAAQRTADPAKAVAIYLQLADLLALAGQWEMTIQMIDAGFARCEGPATPGALDLEAFRAAYRGYDPASVEEFHRDLPRLRALVAERPREESLRLRWILGALGSIRDSSRAEVAELIEPARGEWSTSFSGIEVSTVTQAACALLVVEDFEWTEAAAQAMIDDGRRRGSWMPMTAGLGYLAARSCRLGDLGAGEADLRAMVELAEQNEMSLMAFTTMFHFCIDAIVERPGLEDLATVTEELELPPSFAASQSGGMALEARAAIRAARGDRAGAVADLREVAAIFVPLRAGPRLTRWRSRLALALPESRREEAMSLAAEELEEARAVASPWAEGAALRALGLLRGGEEGIGDLRDSVAVLRGSPSRYELARSLAELGAALRRRRLRAEARDHLREAGVMAQRCGAERLGARIHEELRIAGARPRRDALSGVDALTPSELRVANAALAGATNREIAQDLFVSLRAVEMHLTNTYRKLEISSRSQLAAAIDEKHRSGPDR